jgi:DNA polymerase-3 subunit gamma/tau
MSFQTKITSMALALSRKYRPKQFEDLLGHDTNVEILKNAAKSGEIGQAYLFYGSRGTGKTTTARLIAKLLNCEKRATDPKFRAKGEPCNACSSCREIDAGTSFDVIEIDAASNRGIDEIRNLKESIKTAPAGGRNKVYIIDEVHMLTGPAFNALLKTLEEPPPHVTFVLATTEFEKLPATIVSRTQRFLFKKLPKTTILKKLATIAKAENISITPEALELIAAAAEGSFRDAESLLDQVSSFEEKVDLASAERLIGRVGFQRVEHFARLIIQKNQKEALAYLTEVNEEGQNVVQLTRDLVHYLRKVLTSKLNPALAKSFATELTQEELVRMQALVKDAEPDFLVQTIRALIRAYSEMRYSPFPIVPFEIVLIETLK